MMMMIISNVKLYTWKNQLGYEHISLMPIEKSITAIHINFLYSYFLSIYVNLHSIFY